MDERFSADDHLESNDQPKKVSYRPAAPVRDDHTSGRFSRSWPRRFFGFILSQTLVLAVFIGLPALVTSIVPVSWIKYERRDGQVAANVRVCLLFFIPYKNVRVESVTEFDKRFVAGTVTRERRSGRTDRVTRSEDQGFLVIKGATASTEVQVSPHDLDSVIERSETFLNRSQESNLELFVVANWKFSILMGGAFSLLTVLFFATVLFGIILKLIHLVQKLLGVPPQRRLLVKALAKT